MKGIMVVDVLHSEPLNGLELIFVLADAAQRNTKAVVEMGVGDSDICAIPFKGNAVVPVIHSPVIEGDVRGADRVSSVRVCFLRQF